MPPDGACRNDFGDVPGKVCDSLRKNFDKNLTAGMCTATVAED